MATFTPPTRRNNPIIRVDGQSGYATQELHRFLETLGCEIADTQGPKGDPGADSTVPGPTGPRGSLIYTDVGTPTAGLGIDEDHYINETNGDWYTKDNGVWVLQFSLNVEQEVYVQAIEPTVSSPALWFSETTVDGQTVYQMKVSA